MKFVRVLDESGKYTSPNGGVALGGRGASGKPVEKEDGLSSGCK